jgi:hypothetical protein
MDPITCIQYMIYTDGQVLHTQGLPFDFNVVSFSISWILVYLKLITYYLLILIHMVTYIYYLFQQRNAQPMRNSLNFHWPNYLGRNIDFGSMNGINTVPASWLCNEWNKYGTCRLSMNGINTVHVGWFWEHEWNKHGTMINITPQNQ